VNVGYVYTISDEAKNIKFRLQIYMVKPKSCVGLCVGLFFQNLLKSAKIGKGVEIWIQ